MDRSRSRHDRAFRRSVVVDQLERQGGWGETMQGISTGKQEPEIRSRGPRKMEGLLRQDGRQEADRDLLRDQPVTEQHRREPGFPRGKMDRRTRSQIGPQLPNRGVKTRARDLRGTIVAVHRELSRMPFHEVKQVCVGDLDALGLSGGTGGIDDVREIVRARGIKRSSGRRFRDQEMFETEGRPIARGERRDQALPGDQHRGTGVRHDVGGSVDRIGGVDRQVGSSCFPDPQGGDHKLNGAFEINADRIVDPQAGVQKVCRDEIRLRFQLQKGERTSFTNHRRSMWGLGGSSRNHPRNCQSRERIAAPRNTLNLKQRRTKRKNFAVHKRRPLIDLVRRTLRVRLSHRA